MVGGWEEEEMEHAHAMPRAKMPTYLDGGC